MTFAEASPFNGAMVRFETDALAVDHIPRSGVGVVCSVTSRELVLELPGSGQLTLPLFRVLTLTKAGSGEERIAR